MVDALEPRLGAVVTTIEGGDGFTTEPPHERHVRVLLSPFLQADMADLAVGFTEVGSGVHGSPHCHVDAAEVWMFYSGGGLAIVGETTHRVGPGSVVYTPPGMQHQFINDGQEPARLFWAYCPSGDERAILDHTFR